jgi:hypothetical protein
MHAYTHVHSLDNADAKLVTARKVTPWRFRRVWIREPICQQDERRSRTESKQAVPTRCAVVAA